MKESENLGKAGLIVGLGALAVTYIASRGPYHSKVHKDLAKVAMVAEGTTVLSSIGLLSSPSNRERNTFYLTGGVGLGVTTLCHLAVAMTDVHFTNFLKASGGFPPSKQATRELVNNLYGDFKRHMGI